MLIKIIIGVVAVQHYFIMLMEMFMWEKRGPSIFKSFEKKLFSETTAMAKNLGIYNGFLATALLLTLFITDAMWFHNIALFSLCCVIVAGAYASFTAEKTIFLKQSLLAVVGVIVLLIG